MKQSTAVVLLAVCALLFSIPAIADARISVAVASSEITDEAALLDAHVVAPAAHRTRLTIYLGTREAGAQVGGWEYNIKVGERESGEVQVPVEGLKASTVYYFRFKAQSANGDAWSEPGMFTTKAVVPVENNDAFLKKLDRREIPAHGFISSRPARLWEEGLISGNGKMGAVVLSRPLDEKILLTQEKLFLPVNAKLPPIDMAKLLPQIRQTILEGKYAQAADLMIQESLREGYGDGARGTDSFLPALDLLLHMEPRGAIRNYVRSEDFSTGIASVRWEDERGAFSRRLFVSRADNVVVLSVKSSGKNAINCDLRLGQRAIDKVNDWGVQDHIAKGIKDVETGVTTGWLTYRSSFAQGEGGYQAVARVIVRGGSSTPAGQQLAVRDADEVLVLVRIEPTPKFAQSEISVLENEVAKVRPDFGYLLKRHAKIHGEIFDRVKIDLGGGDDRYLPVEELQAESTVAKPSMALLEKVFEAGRYTILSATGDWPPNLQGKWNGTWGPAWSGDYTVDGNVQGAIASVLNGNMPELMPSLFNFVEGYLPDMRENARRLYGARGIHVSSHMSTHGFNNHFSREYPLTFWTGGAGWIAHYYYDYYQYTGDRKFLAERALPFMKEAALFYEDFLTVSTDGKYVFNPSYSPENTPANSNSQAAINATMDIAITRELLTNLIEACETLKVEPESVIKWKGMLKALPDYEINADGAVKEWTWPTLEDNNAHRHLSHLYPLYYGISPDVASAPKLLAAFHRAAERRMEWRTEKGGGEMAFGMVQLGNVADSLGDGEFAYSVVAGLANRNYYNNLMSSHDPGPSIFNADISGGLPDVMIRMLVQSQPGRIDLLPALPKELASGAIDGVLAKGQIVVKQLKWSPKNCRVVLNSKIAQTITINLPNEIGSIEATPNTVQATEDAKVRTVRLLANTDVELRFVMQ
jgi:alpha-L-fucosidase 2